MSFYMKKLPGCLSTFIYFGLLFLFCANPFGPDPDVGPWLTLEKGTIIINFRPPDHSSTPSPDSALIKAELDTQNIYYSLIAQRLHVSYGDKISIYLYNYDEAKHLIGTNTGGYAEPPKNIIRFTYLYMLADTSLYASNRYLGLHEMVHVIANNKFSQAKNRLMGEGYANAIDGFYGGFKNEKAKFVPRPIESWFSDYKKNGTIYSAEKLLKKNINSIEESVFYPQSGVLIRFWFNRYGVDKVNLMYALSASQIQSRFFSVTNESFSAMDSAYSVHCDSLSKINKPSMEKEELLTNINHL